MDPTFPITLTVNGTEMVREVPVRQTLADFLRQTLGLTATHVGCEHGVCGACTVRIDGRIARACLTFAIQCDGAAIETLEGMAESGKIADLQQAFHRRNALQCGFCTSGMLVTAAQLLEENPRPSREEIREIISGNYCRCTGYHAIVDAVEETAEARAKSEPEGAR
ncbi:(2Fe-2S)-binding protein [Telmatospirillum sp. J64-1]|uniref:(2Fe-2S)-binding protein n=1 Tax=Telmatospirillum sp. J64-1 TaxID=2502183 RepID=UPI00115E355D|nr:(2Fe-2S)-binding protein [Telmatospirillum sp. J64-1]